MPTDNNQQNLNNNQGSFPQTVDVPPLPTNNSVNIPVSSNIENVQESTPAPMTQNPNPIIAPDLPQTESVPPTVMVQTDSKKSPLVKMSLVLLLISALVIAVYFAFKVLGKQKNGDTVEQIKDSSVMQEETVPVEEMPSSDLPLAPETSAMPASDSPDVIPTLPENSP